MEKFRSFLFIFAVALLAQCSTNKHTSPKTINGREVFIVSGGWNVAYGHHAMKVNENGVQIDTTYFNSNTDFLAPGVDTNYFHRNDQTFQIEIARPINSREIYKLLLTLPLDSLKRYSKETMNAIGDGFMTQEIQITEATMITKLSFWMPYSPTAYQTTKEKFLYGLAYLFPFRAGDNRTAENFYR